MRTNSGLTLIEVLMALGIGTIVTVLLLTIMVNSAGLFYKESSKLTQGLNINDTLYKLRASIKEAYQVATSYSVGPTTYTSSTNQIVLEVPSIDSSDNIIPQTFDYFVYFLDQNKLRLKTFPNAQSNRKAQDQIFTTLVDSLIFKYFDGANPANEVVPTSAVKVRITLTLKQKSGASFEISTATSEASLRND